METKETHRKRPCDKRGRDWWQCQLLQAVEHQKLQPQVARRGNKLFFPTDFRESMVLLMPWFWMFSPQNWERVHFCCFKPPSLWFFVTATSGNHYKYHVLEKSIQTFLWWKNSQRHSLIDTNQPFKPAPPECAGRCQFFFLIWGILAHSNQPAVISIFCVNIALYVHHSARSSKGRKSPSRQVLMNLLLAWW